MRIFLGNPPWRRGNRLGVRAGSRWPFTMEMPEGARVPHYLPFPFFLAYATAVLERERFPVMLVDAIAEGLTDEEYLARVKAFNPDLIVHETSTASIDVDLAIAVRCKEATGAQIALAGPHASVMAEGILNDHASVDYILIGEYELTLRELCGHIEKGAPLDTVGGLCFRAADGSVHTTPRRPSLKELDTLPWPARHFLPMPNYLDGFCGMPHPMLQMWSSRGCPYKCIFCLWPEVMYGDHRYRTRDPKNVVDEIESCHQQYRFASFYFDDDTFNIGRERILALCAEIKGRNLGIPWAAMCRADMVDEEMLRAMKESGLIAVKYGIESSSQAIVDACGKGLNLKKTARAIELTRALGIKFHLTFTFGLPGETVDSIRDTIDFALRTDPDGLQFSLATPFPGTHYHEALQKEGNVVARSWSEYDGSGKSVIRTPQLSREELEHWLVEAHRCWDKHQEKRRAAEKRVTLYIPCYNAAKTLEECVQSVLTQSHPIDEILIIDDGSTDETVEIASRYSVRIIRHGKNLGLAASRNTAFREAQNEFIAAADADVVLDRNWLQHIMNNFSDPKVIGACGMLVEKYQSALPDAWRATHMPQHWGEEKITNPYFLFGADNIYKKSSLITLGLYNECFRTNFEDVDMGIRLAKAGKTFIYDPLPCAYHLRRDTITSVLRSYYRWYSMNYPEPFSFPALTHRFGVYFGDLLRMLQNDFRGDKKLFIAMDVLLWAYRSCVDACCYLCNIVSSTP